MGRKWFYKLKQQEDKKAVNTYQRDIDEMCEVIYNPPHTWSNYHTDPQRYQKVIDMEMQELHECKAMGDHRGYTENLIHVAAACIAAHHAMTCKEYD